MNQSLKKHRGGLIMPDVAWKAKEFGHSFNGNS